MYLKIQGKREQKQKENYKNIKSNKSTTIKQLLTILTTVTSTYTISKKSIKHFIQLINKYSTTLNSPRCPDLENIGLSRGITTLYHALLLIHSNQISFYLYSGFCAELQYKVLKNTIRQ